jgi:hypothetical protein
VAGGSEAAVRAWVERTLGSADVDVVRVPHLSTPSHDFFVVSQRRLGPAGEVYAMSDGDEVFPAGRDNLAEVLRREGVLEDPERIPPEQLAELYVRMGEVRRVRVLADPSDFALASLDPEARKRFQPPSVRKADGGVEATFWTAGPEPDHVERWRVTLDSDGTLSHEVERVD